MPLTELCVACEQQRVLRTRRVLRRDRSIDWRAGAACDAGLARGAAASSVKVYTPPILHLTRVGFLWRGLFMAVSAGLSPLYARGEENLAHPSSVRGRGRRLSRGLESSSAAHKQARSVYAVVIPSSACRVLIVSARERMARRCRRPMGSFSTAGTTLMAINTGPFWFMISPI